MHASARPPFAWRPLALIVLVAIAGAVLGGAVGTLLPSRYSAEATVKVGLTSGSSAAVQQRLAVAYAQAAASTSMRRTVNAAPHDRLTSDAGASAGVVHVTATGDGAIGAADLANAVVQQLQQSVPGQAAAIAGSHYVAMSVVRNAAVPSDSDGIGISGVALIGLVVGALVAGAVLLMRRRRVGDAASRRPRDVTREKSPPLPVRVPRPATARRR